MSLKTGKDIYGNKADNINKILSITDLASFGTLKVFNTGIIKSSSNTKKAIDLTNKLTTLGGSVKTIKTEKQK